VGVAVKGGELARRLLAGSPLPVPPARGLTRLAASASARMLRASGEVNT
jgi:hypothetical protein